MKFYMGDIIEYKSTFCDVKFTYLITKIHYKLNGDKMYVINRTWDNTNRNACINNISNYTLISDIFRQYTLFDKIKIWFKYEI